MSANDDRDDAFPPVSGVGRAPPETLPLRLYPAARPTEGFSLRGWLGELPWGALYWLALTVVLVSLLFFIGRYWLRVQHGQRIQEAAAEIAQYEAELAAVEQERADYRREVTEQFAGSGEEPDWNYATFRATGNPFADDIGARMFKGSRMAYQEHDAALGVRVDQVELKRDGAQTHQIRLQRSYKPPQGVPIAIFGGAFAVLVAAPIVMRRIAARG